MKDILQYIFGGGPRSVTCVSCKYQEDGACRRYPPARVYTGDRLKSPDALDVTVWPVVRPAQDWCGEHERR